MAAPEQPLIVAHRAGNHLDKLAEAFALGVDYAETDVWLHRGRLEVRHEKTLGPLPLLYDRGRLFPGWKSSRASGACRPPSPRAFASGFLVLRLCSPLISWRDLRHWITFHFSKASEFSI